MLAGDGLDIDQGLLDAGDRIRIRARAHPGFVIECRFEQRLAREARCLQIVTTAVLGAIDAGADALQRLQPVVGGGLFIAATIIGAGSLEGRTGRSAFADFLLTTWLLPMAEFLLLSLLRRAIAIRARSATLHRHVGGSHSGGDGAIAHNALQDLHIAE